jgi:glycosyltransferase involved in cell wall biosynthesis
MTGPVVLLTTNLARGGAETQVALLALSLSRRGWPVSVVSLLDPSAFQAELREANVQVRSLGMQPGRPNPLALARLAAILRKERPCVLHSHMFHANLLARLMRLAFPAPLIVSTLHSMAESSRHSTGTRLRDWLYRVTDPLADATVAVCQAVAERHVASGAVRRGKLRVIPNGVDTERFRPDAARRERLRGEFGAGGEFVWLAVGRLMWKKDYPTMLRAAARQREGILLIAGAGPLETELAALARELRVRTPFLGPREDVPALMNAADGLVLSSVVEGLPMALLEAAASGLPCVTTDVGGARDAVVDGQTGFVTPRGNPEALAEAMARLTELPGAARREMGQAARELALARFDMGLVTSQWEQLYREHEAQSRAGILSIGGRAYRAG